MSFEDEVMPSLPFLRKHRLDLCEGSASSTHAYQARECGRQSTSEEDGVFTDQTDGEADQEPQYVRSGVVQVNDPHGTPRGACICREFVRESSPWHRVFRGLAGICEGGVSLVLSTRVDLGLIQSRQAESQDRHWDLSGTWRVH